MEQINQLRSSLIARTRRRWITGYRKKKHYRGCASARTGRIGRCVCPAVFCGSPLLLTLLMGRQPCDLLKGLGKITAGAELKLFGNIPDWVFSAPSVSRPSLALSATRPSGGKGRVRRQFILDAPGQKHAARPVQSVPDRPICRLTEITAFGMLQMCPARR